MSVPHRIRPLSHVSDDIHVSPVNPHHVSPYPTSTSKVRETAGLHVLRIDHRQLASMEEFIGLIYERELAGSREMAGHIAHKTAYLQALAGGGMSRVAVVTLGDALPVRAQYGGGEHRVTANKNIVDLKWKLREAFNPRLSTGKMTHEHTVHVTDTSADAWHLLSTLGYVHHTTFPAMYVSHIYPNMNTNTDTDTTQI